MSFQRNPKKMLEQAKAMQERLKGEIDRIRVEASTGGGMVTVRMDGNKSVISVVIEPEAAKDIEMLQDMVRGACNEAAKRVDSEAQRRLGGIMGGLGLPGGLMG